MNIHVYSVAKYEKLLTHIPALSDFHFTINPLISISMHETLMKYQVKTNQYLEEDT